MRVELEPRCLPGQLPCLAHGLPDGLAHGLPDVSALGHGLSYALTGLDQGLSWSRHRTSLIESRGIRTVSGEP
ncbi:hypothetical protein GCM10010412_029840 [Nonomuraea recticatena]|uniref:Uncharacterized protein n=1 Tax=Nonomuraea recticatena TaxID=46178 RepID=A0ABP6E799_9ACTN